ncbi:Transposase_IS4 [Hexamita inflata]|uniref:Transposase IS4 n=2 Tax=Hexamita inflata TaxID=28002 RepID=A0AA86T9U4_9EUKA|nr:Transposase IS4 [Hexamita inflata]
MSQEDAFRIFRQYMNPSVVQRIITKTQAKLSSRITNLKQNERLRQKINNFDEYQFWTFIDVSLVMFLSPRSGIQEYWSTNEMLGNAFIKKLIQREHYFQIYQSISWEENESDISQNWLQKQIINNVQKQLINNFFDKTVLNQFTGTDWPINSNSDGKENNNILTNPNIIQNVQEEFPYLHLPIHSDLFQKTILQQKQQKRYYRRVLKQEQPLTEKQVKNINQMKTQDEHYKQLLTYIEFDHPTIRQQTKQFIYCLQVCIINSFIVFRHQYQDPNLTYEDEDDRLHKQRWLTIRQFVQLLIDAIDDFRHEMKQETPVTSDNPTQIQQQVSFSMHKKDIKLVASGQIEKIMEEHQLIPLKLVRTEFTCPTSRCCMCKAKVDIICTCNNVLCNDCHIKHLLIELEQNIEAKKPDAKQTK